MTLHSLLLAVLGLLSGLEPHEDSIIQGVVVNGSQGGIPLAGAEVILRRQGQRLLGRCEDDDRPGRLVLVPRLQPGNERTVPETWSTSPAPTGRASTTPAHDCASTRAAHLLAYNSLPMMRLLHPALWSRRSLLSTFKSIQASSTLPKCFSSATRRQPPTSAAQTPTCLRPLFPCRSRKGFLTSRSTKSLTGGISGLSMAAWSQASRGRPANASWPLFTSCRWSTASCSSVALSTFPPPAFAWPSEESAPPRRRATFLA